MFLKLVQELVYLRKFKKSVKNKNYDSAMKYLKAHKQASDDVESELAKSMAQARNEAQKQKSQVIDLIVEIEN